MDILFVIGVGVFLYGVLFGDKGGKQGGCKVNIPGFGHVDPADPKLFFVDKGDLWGLIDPKRFIVKSMLSADKDRINDLYNGDYGSRIQIDTECGGDGQC